MTFLKKVGRLLFSIGTVIIYLFKHNGKTRLLWYCLWRFFVSKRIFFFFRNFRKTGSSPTFNLVRSVRLVTNPNPKMKQIPARSTSTVQVRYYLYLYKYQEEWCNNIVQASNVVLVRIQICILYININESFYIIKIFI